MLLMDCLSIQVASADDHSRNALATDHLQSASHTTSVLSVQEEGCFTWTVLSSASHPDCMTKKVQEFIILLILFSIK